MTALTPSVLASSSNGEPTTLLDLPRPSATVEPGNSVAVPIGRVTIYITEVLRALGAPQTEPFARYVPLLAAQTFRLHLTPLGRPSHWLPQMEPHKFIALRFLPQSEYEAAAPLSISPSPKAVVRVLMLFKGLDAQAAVQWDSPTPSLSQGSSIWTTIVGPGTTTIYCPFYVVELAGMEVP
jgi:hypothetical protein